jgi:serine/threonine-protein kinase HipA
VYNDEVKKWLSVLMAGFLLGGAPRPKPNILDNDKSLWIAKFRIKTDTTDKELPGNSYLINWQ